MTKALILQFIVFFLLSCKGPKKTNTSYAGPVITQDIPVMVSTTPAVLSDTISNLLKARRYEVVPQHEFEKYMKKGWEKFFAEMKRQGISDQELMKEKIKKVSPTCIDLSIKFFGDSSSNRVDSARWQATEYLSMNSSNRTIIMRPGVTFPFAVKALVDSLTLSR